MKNKKRKDIMVKTIQFIILLVIGVLMMIPFVWMISVGFDKTANIHLPFPPTLIPDQISSFNYSLVFENGRLVHAYINSAIVTGTTVILCVSASLLAGYAFSKGEFKGKKVLFVIVLATLMIPIEPRLIPLYKLFNSVDLLNTFWSVILPPVVNGMLIFLCKQFFDQLPNSLGESARMDGAGEFRTFYKIYLPLAGPVAATMVILSFIWSWNDFMWPLIALTDESLQTVPLFLASFAQNNGTNIAGLTMALATLSVLPVIIVFLFLQRYIIQSIALSGLKE